LRVVYEIRSRLEEASATPTPTPGQETPKNPQAPQSERQLKNDLLRHGPSTMASLVLAGLGGAL